MLKYFSGIQVTSKSEDLQSGIYLFPRGYVKAEKRRME